MDSLFDLCRPGGDAATQGSPPDPCERKHGGNPCSAEAWERAQHGLNATRQTILDYIRSTGANGATSKDVQAYLEVQVGQAVGLNVFSGRLSELRQAGLIVDSGRRRDGCAVLVAAEVMLGRKS